MAFIQAAWGGDGHLYRISARNYPVLLVDNPYSIAVGEFHNELSHINYLFLRALEEIDLVKIVGDESYDMDHQRCVQEKTWTSYFNCMTGIIGREINVVSTDKSRLLAESYGEEFDGSRILVKMNSEGSVEIVDTKVFEVGVETYAVVKFRVDSVLTDEGRQVYKILNEVLKLRGGLHNCLQTNLEDNSYKVVGLFKLDSFNCAWSDLGSDSSKSRDGSFCTNFVDRILKSLK